MAFTSAYVDIRSRKPLRKVLFNVADISLALSTGGLVLHAFGIQGAITDRGSIPLTWGIGILAGRHDGVRHERDARVSRARVAHRQRIPGHHAAKDSR